MHRLLLLAPALAVLTFAGVTSPAAAATTKRCTIIAKPAQRIVHGTAKADVICARSGASKQIWGSGGNDTIYTGAAGGRVHGGTGNDTIISGSGPDIINGGPGNDTLIAQNNDDIIAGNAGNDLLEGGAGNDTLNGGPGNDVLEPGTGDNTCEGGGGDDTLGPWCDTAPPQLQELTVSTPSVDTSQGPQIVTFTLRVTDDMTGFWEGWAQIGYQDGAPSTHFDAADRISGDDHDGVYHVSVTMPQNLPARTYNLLFQLYDNQRNHNSYAAWKLQPLGLPSTIVQTGQGDTTAPALVSMSLPGSATVDTSSSPQSVEIDLHATDDSSGVAHGTIEYEIDQPWTPNTSLNAVMNLGFSSTNLVSGNATDGNYTLQMRLPAHSGQGTWVLQGVWLWDAMGNVTVFTPPTAPLAGHDYDIHQIGAGDLIPPVLQSVTFTPRSVDESGNVQVQMTAYGSDEGGAGLFSATCYLESPNHLRELRFFAGSPKPDGEMTGITTIPAKSVQPGVWTGTCGAIDGIQNVSDPLSAPPLTITLP